MQQKNAAMGVKRTVGKWLIWSRRHKNVGQSRVGSRCLLATSKITRQSWQQVTERGAQVSGTLERTLNDVSHRFHCWDFFVLNIYAKIGTIDGCSSLQD